MLVLTLLVAASVVRVTPDALVEEVAESVPLFNKIFGLTPRQEQQKRNDEQRKRDVTRELEQREASVALFKAYGYTDGLYESDEEEAPAVRRSRPSGSKPRKSLVRLQRTEGLNGELAKVVGRQSGKTVVKLLTAGADGRKRQLSVAAKQLADPLALVLEKGATVRIVNANHAEDNGKLATVIKPGKTEKGDPRYEIAFWNGAALEGAAASPNALVPVREHVGSTVRIEPGQTIALLPTEYGAPALHGRVLAHADVPHSWIVLVDGEQRIIKAKHLYATEASPPDGIA